MPPPHKVDNNGFAIPVANGKCEFICTTASRIDKRLIGQTRCNGQFQGLGPGAFCHQISIKKRADIAPEFSQVFSARGLCIIAHGVIDNVLRQGRVHGAGWCPRDQHAPVSVITKGALERIP